MISPPFTHENLLKVFFLWWNKIGVAPIETDFLFISRCNYYIRSLSDNYMHFPQREDYFLEICIRFTCVTAFLVFSSRFFRSKYNFHSKHIHVPRDHLFSLFAKFSEKLTLFAP